MSKDTSNNILEKHIKRHIKTPISLDSNLCRWDVDLYHLDAGLAEKLCRICRNRFRCIYRHIIPLGMYISSSFYKVTRKLPTRISCTRYTIDIPAPLVPNLGRSRDLGLVRGFRLTFRLPFSPWFLLVQKKPSEQGKF